MLGLGFWEIIIIGLIALIVIGPERLPDFAKSVAKFLNEMKRTASDLKTSFDDEKDIFKENIDQIQKFKSELQALPNLLKEDKTKKLQNYEIHPEDESELTSVYEENYQEELPLDLNSSIDKPALKKQSPNDDSEKGEG